MVMRDPVTEKHYSLYLDDEILLKSVNCSISGAQCFLISLVARFSVNYINVESLYMGSHQPGLVTLITSVVGMTGNFM
jgi:hypothetical protein